MNLPSQNQISIVNRIYEKTLQYVEKGGNLTQHEVNFYPAQDDKIYIVMRFSPFTESGNKIDETIDQPEDFLNSPLEYMMELCAYAFQAFSVNGLFRKTEFFVNVVLPTYATIPEHLTPDIIKGRFKNFVQDMESAHWQAEAYCDSDAKTFTMRMYYVPVVDYS